VASHDLREPMRKVRAFGDRLKTRCIDALSPEGRDYVERMQKAAQRMETLIEDLLTFARVTTNARPFVAVELGTIVDDVLCDLELQIGRTAGRVDAGWLPTIDADPTQMRQLFQNLIANALKFHRATEPPVVKISGRLVEGEVKNGRENCPCAVMCEIAIADTGIGFDEKYLDRIFTMFQRLHSREQYEGTGVGLAVCRKIVERHGGSISAHSTPAHGATFVATLPLKHANGAHAS
jgi:signal transduction histidine kinase